MPGGHRSAPDRAGRREGAEPYGLDLDLKWALAREKRGKQRSVFPGRRSAEKVASRSPLRHAKGMTPPPKGEARLGSPFGRAVAARRLRGQLASASTQPMRRGRWHLAHSVDKCRGTWYHRDRKREPAGKTAGPVYLLLRESSRFLGGAATFSCF